MTRPTVEARQAMRERCAKATGGPWRVGFPVHYCHLRHNDQGTGHGGPQCRYTFDHWLESETMPFELSRDCEHVGVSLPAEDESIAGTYNYEEGGFRTREDADFTAHARTDLPALLDALDESEQEVARLKVLVAYVRGWIDEDQAVAATGLTRDALWHLWDEVGKEGTALVQTAGKGKS